MGSKLLSIQVPFLFKAMVDALAPVQDAALENSTLSTIAAALGVDHSVGLSVALAAVPTAILLGCELHRESPLAQPDAPALTLGCADGAARITTTAFAELRNVVFASVAQRAIRLVSGDLFRHLHAMDLRFHLGRQTGGLQRVMDRGSRSINFVLTSLVFNVVPTALEIALVSAILAAHFGPAYAAVTLGTMAAYVGFTVAVTTWRDGIRKELNRLENQVELRGAQSRSLAMSLGSALTRPLRPANLVLQASTTAVDSLLVSAAYLPALATLPLAGPLARLTAPLYRTTRPSSSLAARSASCGAMTRRSPSSTALHSSRSLRSHS